MWRSCSTTDSYPLGPVAPRKRFNSFDGFDSQLNGRASSSRIPLASSTVRYAPHPHVSRDAFSLADLQLAREESEPLRHRRVIFYFAAYAFHYTEKFATNANANANANARIFCCVDLECLLCSAPRPLPLRLPPFFPSCLCFPRFFDRTLGASK